MGEQAIHRGRARAERLAELFGHRGRRRVVGRLGRLQVSEAVVRRLALGLELVKVDLDGRAHRRVREAAVVRRFVDDHRVLHVVARVRDDGDHRVRAERVLVEPIANEER